MAVVARWEKKIKNILYFKNKCVQFGIFVKMFFLSWVHVVIRTTLMRSQR